MSYDKIINHWYVSKYTYILYLLNPQKRPKTHKWPYKCYKYHWNVFLCDSGTKRLKTSEKQTSLHNCHFQSLKLHKLSKLVPESLKWKKSQLKSLGSQTYSQTIPGWKFTQNGNFYPSSYKLAKLVPGYLKMEFYPKILLYYS
jgi:hypothetical protein